MKEKRKNLSAKERAAIVREIQKVQHERDEKERVRLEEIVSRVMAKARNGQYTVEDGDHIRVRLWFYRIGIFDYTRITMIAEEIYRVDVVVCDCFMGIYADFLIRLVG